MGVELSVSYSSVMNVYNSDRRIDWDKNAARRGQELERAARTDFLGKGRLHSVLYDLRLDRVSPSKRTLGKLVASGLEATSTFDLITEDHRLIRGIDIKSGTPEFSSEVGQGRIIQGLFFLRVAAQDDRDPEAYFFFPDNSSLWKLIAQYWEVEEDFVRLCLSTAALTNVVSSRRVSVDQREVGFQFGFDADASPLLMIGSGESESVEDWISRAGRDPGGVRQIFDSTFVNIVSNSSFEPL